MFEEKNQTKNFNRSTVLFPEEGNHIESVEESYSALKDSLISFEFRIETLEKQINSKVKIHQRQMERNECMTLLQRKANSTQLKKACDQINLKIESDKARDEQKFQEAQEEQMKKISDLKKRLSEAGGAGHSSAQNRPHHMGNILGMQKISSQIDKVLVKPQELFLESNETMFGMLVDEIKELKKADSTIEKLIEAKHKKNISLNNEVCRKLEYLEQEIEETIRYIDTNSFLDGKAASQPKGKKSQKGQHTNVQQNEAFESIRLELLGKTVENIQKQLSHKLNIKDVLPMIKQNSTNLEGWIEETQKNMEENFESTRRILSSQAEINQEISSATKIGWWKCSLENGVLAIDKELINIIPQALVCCGEDSESVSDDRSFEVTVKEQGWYHIALSMGESNHAKQKNNIEYTPLQSAQLSINGNCKTIDRETVLRLNSGSALRVLLRVNEEEAKNLQESEFFVKIQKLA